MSYREQQEKLLYQDQEAWRDSIKKVLPPGHYDLNLRVSEEGTVVVNIFCHHTSCESAGTADRPLVALSQAIYSLRDKIDKKRQKNFTALKLGIIRENLED